jgi:hypothetical protein
MRQEYTNVLWVETNDGDVLARGRFRLRGWLERAYRVCETG